MFDKWAHVQEQGKNLVQENETFKNMNSDIFEFHDFQNKVIKNGYDLIEFLLDNFDQNSSNRDEIKTFFASYYHLTLDPSFIDNTKVRDISETKFIVMVVQDLICRYRIPLPCQGEIADRFIQFMRKILD